MTTVEPEPTDLTSPLSLPASRYPTGWFMVSWSDELDPGEVKLVHYFGRDIVLWRGESGKVYAADAYCLHIGGNLGVKGTVAGEEIVCPWHLWQWDGEGRNTLIPYSEQRRKENVRLEVWPLRETQGTILLWHDSAGGPPTWEPPTYPQLDDPEYYPINEKMRICWRIKAHPQIVMENGVDVAHIAPIHGAGVVPTVISTGGDGHKWVTKVKASYGAGKEKTWLTPEGAIEAHVEFHLWGLGIGCAFWPADMLFGSLMPSFVTPVDETHSDFFWRITAKREPGADDEPTEKMYKFFAHQQFTITEDFFTWENMKVLQTPSFAPEEAPHFAKMRRWARQFYPGLESPVEVKS